MGWWVSGVAHFISYCPCSSIQIFIHTHISTFTSLYMYTHTHMCQHWLTVTLSSQDLNSLFSLSRASGRLFKKMKHLLLVWWPCNLLDDLSEWQSRGMDAIAILLDASISHRSSYPPSSALGNHLTGFWTSSLLLPWWHSWCGCCQVRW